MVFRLDPTLASTVLARQPGSDPHYVNPQLLAEEKRKTDIQAGLSIAGMMANETAAQRSMKLRGQEFEAEGWRAIAQHEMKRELDANAAAAELFRTRVQIEGEMMKQREKSAADFAQSEMERRSAETIADADRLSAESRAKADRDLKKHEQWWERWFDKPMEHAREANLKREEWGAAEKRAALQADAMRGQMDMSAAVSLFGQNARIASEISDTYESDAKQMLDRSKVWGEAATLFQGRDIVTGKGGPVKEDDSEQRMAALMEGLSQMSGGKGAKAPPREIMIGEYMSLMGSYPPVEMRDAELAAFLSRSLADKAEESRARGRGSLEQIQNSGAGLLKILLGRRASGEQVDVTPVLEGLLRSTADMGRLEGSTFGRYAEALQKDLDAAKRWLGVGEQVFGIPAPPQDAAQQPR